ncbi:hypothetical protein GALMADRAFT_149044 [Galerina marginata CBS 339.88]|uniref:Uncharacterized protein n=1 Tax=Galerina marginata (strain CBS 339.88) TaxID=685588 RepID=A0A067SE56_GALM3|nr:hypothetical protein GALMADRAFT_149044 [Galerina marginata CBS 339.88]
MPIKPPGPTYINCYGRERHSDTDVWIIEPYSRPNPPGYVGTDALVIHEYKCGLQYALPGLDFGVRGEEDDRGYLRPTGIVITSPNMDWILDIMKDSNDVLARIDGFYFLADTCKAPQNFYLGTYFLPFVLVRPPDSEISRHEFGLAWRVLKRSDFVLEKGAEDSGLGRIDSALADEFVALRKMLSSRIQALIDEARWLPIHYDELRYSRTGMHYSSLTLTFAPQTFEDTLLNVNTFQRHVLEALACYSYLKVWKEREMNLDVDSPPRPVDKSIMGALTVDTNVAIRLHAMGVPTWLIRTPSRIPHDMNISRECIPSIPNGLERAVMPNKPAAYSGVACATRNRACQRTGMQNIRLGHSAFHITSEQQVSNYEHDNVILRDPDEVFPARATRQKALPAIASPSNPPPALSTSSTAGARLPATSGRSTSSTTTGLPSSCPWRRISVEEQFAIDTTKFHETRSVLEPEANALWKLARQNVNTDWRRIINHPDLKLLHGYPIFPPSILMNDKPGQPEWRVGRTLQYAVAWLVIRVAWFSRTTNRLPTSM